MNVFDDYEIELVNLKRKDGYKTGKNKYLPYPLHEILVNPNINQNPGW